MSSQNLRILIIVMSTRCIECDAMQMCLLTRFAVMLKTASIQRQEAWDRNKLQGIWALTDCIAFAAASCASLRPEAPHALNAAWPFRTPIAAACTATQHALQLLPSAHEEVSTVHSFRGICLPVTLRKSMQPNGITTTVVSCHVDDLYLSRK